MGYAVPAQQLQTLNFQRFANGKVLLQLILYIHVLLELPRCFRLCLPKFMNYLRLVQALQLSTRCQNLDLHTKVPTTLL